MLEFTILMSDDRIEFEPFKNRPSLEFMLPPTARIGDEDDNIHLDPIPVHGFFNAITFSKWLADANHISTFDAFVIYLLHDMFKSLLRFVEPDKRHWYHAETMFDGIGASLRRSTLFQSFDTSYRVMTEHHRRKEHRTRGIVRLREATWHEKALAPPEDKWLVNPQAIGLHVKLQPALSNIFAIAHIKSLFIDAYVEALKNEYASVFQRLNEITYRYEFISPGQVSSNIQSDVDELCQKSNIILDDKRLRIETFIGAYSPVAPGEQTHIKLPFWLLLTIHEDPTSIIFPVPSLPSELPNKAFVDRVKTSFRQKFTGLLNSVPSAGKRWDQKKVDILNHLGDTVTIADGDFTSVQEARAALAPGEVCGLCGSAVPEAFLCSPETDLGWNSGRYTDWHQGNIASTCLLCAISNFKVPPELQAAHKLVKQKKLVYFAITTPNTSDDYENRLEGVPIASVLPFFEASIEPRLVISSLESLVTLNLIGALFLHSSVRLAEIRGDGERELWLQGIPGADPFTFVGEIGKRRSKREISSLLTAMYQVLSRPVTVIDPILKMGIEVPFHTLICIMGNAQGRHYELKFKPLAVSNKTGMLPVVCEGYHFINSESLEAIREVGALLQGLRAKGVTDRMKVAALASGPNEFVNLMIGIGGYNAETVLEQLAKLAPGQNPIDYLEDLSVRIHQNPLTFELWR